MAQDIGPLIPGWTAAQPPEPTPMAGHHAELAPLTPDHAPALWQGFAGHPNLWLYMASGPFPDQAAFASWISTIAGKPDPLFYAIRPRGGRWSGMASFMRIVPKDGVMEVGNICLGPALQGTAAATEAMALMMGHAFDLGYRRYEWKCNALNQPSRRAAQRLGFSYEGLFRQHMVIKGRNRDTAWFSVTDAEWPALRSAYLQWLAPDNFLAGGRQKTALSDLTAALVTQPDPSLIDA